MRLNHILFYVLCISITGLLLNAGYAPEALAASSTAGDLKNKAGDENAGMEEIVVTATRRKESLLRVPVSVNVVSGNQIKAQAMQDLDDLSNWVPGFTVREGGEQTGISARGFGSGLNFGFDQSVGLFLDGMYEARERQFRAMFLDIGSVQVLKGPQATLFGKNTIAGAVIIQTNQPTHDFQFNVASQLGVGNEPRKQVQGFVNGELTPDIAGRLAYRYSEDDGYMYNTLIHEREEQTRDWTLRPTFLWTPMDNLKVYLKLEYSKYHRNGRAFKVSDIGGPFSNDTTNLGPEAQLSSYLAYDPNFDWGLNNRTSKQLETADVRSKNTVLRVDYNLAAATLTSITAFSAYDSHDGRDVDWTPTTFLYEPINEHFKQWSQEFRLISNTGGKFDYILGAYMLGNSFYVDRRTDINIEVYLLPYGVQPYSQTIFGGPASDWEYAQLRFLDQGDHDQSVYGQGTWHITEQVALTGGLRWNREDKKGHDKYNLSQFGTDRFLDLNNPTDLALINRVRSVLPANVNGILANAREGRGEVVETDWSPSVTLSWYESDATMFYAKYVQGHQSGGFNSQTIGQTATDFTFGPETAFESEIGGKFQLDNGYINVDIFREEFKNLQTSVWTGQEFDVGNAGKARSQGLEFDSRYRITDSLGIRGSFEWLDARYLSNRLNACSISQLYFGATGCHDQSGLANTNPSSTPPYFQDETGKRFAPMLQASAGINYEHAIGAGMEMQAGLDATYFPHQVNPADKTLEEPSVTLVDISATLHQTSGPWSFGVLVKNATDRHHWWYEFEAPAQPGTRIGFYAPPRTVAFNLTYNYR